MGDAENDGAIARTRKRRSNGPSALSDISNVGSNYLQSFNSIAKKVTKKPRLSEEEVVAEVQPETCSRSTGTTTSSVRTRSAYQQASTSATAATAVVDLTVDTSRASDPSFAETKTYERTPEEVAFERHGFAQPPKLLRSAPLQAKGSDPALCLDLLDDMYGFYMHDEMEYTAKNYFTLGRQSEVTPRMRTILVDWLLEVHYKYKLQPQTLWLCINLIDRFLEKEDIARGRLQLVGITALFIACKFEEVNAPEVRDCVYLTDNAYTKQEILQMEARMLDVLDYQLHVPTGYHFLIKLFNRIKASERVRLAVSFVAERNMYEPDMLDYSPRVFTAAAMLAGLYCVYDELDGFKTASDIWTPALQEESGLSLKQIRHCAMQLIDHVHLVHTPSTRRRIDAVKKKYDTCEKQHICLLAYPPINY